MTTINAAKDQYLATEKSRIGLMGKWGITPQTYNMFSYDLNRAVEATDTAKDICTLTQADVRQVCQHWMGSGLSQRTAYNRIRTFKALLEYAADNLDGYVPPKGIAELWKRCRPGSQGDGAIMPFDGDALTKVLAEANDQVRLYCLLALNAGQYQQDISDLTPGNLQGHILVWSRAKTVKQGKIVLRHRLWPETLRYIERCRSRQNGFGRLLVTAQGTPLVTRTVDQRDSDSIGKAWNRACKAAGVKLPFKQLRKWGATFIADEADMDTQRMFRGEVIPGSSKAYVVQNFESRLFPALEAWRSRLLPVLSTIA